MTGRLNKMRIQSGICAEASQILLTAEQNLKFCPRPQHKTLRNGGKDEKILGVRVSGGYDIFTDCLR